MATEEDARPNVAEVLARARVLAAQLGEALELAEEIVAEESASKPITEQD